IRDTGDPVGRYLILCSKEEGRRVGRCTLGKECQPQKYLCVVLKPTPHRWWEFPIGKLSSIAWICLTLMLQQLLKTAPLALQGRNHERQCQLNRRPSRSAVILFRVRRFPSCCGQQVRAWTLCGHVERSKSVDEQTEVVRFLPSLDVEV